VRTAADVMAQHAAHLTAYQNAAYAARYTSFMESLAGPESFRMAVARNLAKLMAYKDEYEVARLFVAPAFDEALSRQFSGDFKLTYHLSPPLLARRDPHTGLPQKRAFGAGLRTVFSVLAKLKGVRGTAFDVFGYTAERRQERQLIEDYRSLMMGIAPCITPANLGVAIALADLPEAIRGFGHVKHASIAVAKAKEQQLLGRFDSNEILKKAAE
jgi:indolepyruvate ferredoxin oxidoreductase